MNAIRKLFPVMFLSACVVLFGGSLSSFARDVSVHVATGGAFTYFPLVTNITAGDRVIWTWDATDHSVTSSNTTPSYNSGVLLTVGAKFTNTFSTPGTYSYYCTVHVATFHMTGEVLVASGSLPPTVTITNPANGAILSAPASFNLAASTMGTVTNVQFFQNTASLGNVTSSPFSVPVNSLAAGGYTFSAVATDNTGSTATNSITISVVTPVPMVLSGEVRQPPASFHFSFTANTGLNYVVQRSTNLASANWTPLSTNTAGSSSVTFTDANATVNPGFYRVGRLPNP